jgi:hypothetical protein
MFTPSLGVNDVNERPSETSSRAVMFTLSTNVNDVSLDEDPPADSTRARPRRPTVGSVAYMSTTAIASAGATFTPWDEHNDDSRAAVLGPAALHHHLFFEARTDDGHQRQRRQRHAVLAHDRRTGGDPDVLAGAISSPWISLLLQRRRRLRCSRRRHGRSVGTGDQAASTRLPRGRRAAGWAPPDYCSIWDR